VPSAPKWTYTPIPSAIGVGDAWTVLRVQQVCASQVKDFDVDRFATVSAS
jgi:hypothetical protein